MSEPLQRESPHAIPDELSDRDRDAKIEQLLLVGLDHYFSAQYEQAINVWTRALFLDRSHARARAYIERARSAVAERQRESEELLQTGLAAFSRGEGDEARRLLQAAIHHGAQPDEALAVLDRLSRLEQGPLRPPGATRVDRSRLLPEVHDRRAQPGWGLIAFVVAVTLVAAGGFVFGTDMIDWRSLVAHQAESGASTIQTTSLAAGLPIPLRAQTALDRARAFQAGGRLRDALSALDLIRPTDAQKPDADRLRAAIQKQLLSIASADGVSPPDLPKGDGPLP